MPNERKYLAPAEGRKVRNPQDMNKPLPEAGGWVELDTHFRRRLRDGDAVEATPPRAPKPAPKPSKPAAKEEN